MSDFMLHQHSGETTRNDLLRACASQLRDCADRIPEYSEEALPRARQWAEDEREAYESAASRIESLLDPERYIFWLMVLAAGFIGGYLCALFSGVAR